MNFLLFDNVLFDPDEYVEDILRNDFVDIYDGTNVFKNIQPRDYDLSKEHPEQDGTTIYDSENQKTCTFYAKYNRMVVFDSKLPHSRNIFENFGSGESARLVQVAFLKEVV